MGKQKRAREKYHIACVKAKNQEKSGEVPKLSNENPALKWKVELKDDLFKGININVDNLLKVENIHSVSNKVLDDDRVSVRSLSKTIRSKAGGKLLKKDEKRKLRHNLFIQKIDNIYKSLKSNKGSKGKKLSQAANANDSMITEPMSTEELLNKVPVKVKKERPTPRKQKGILKAKQRQKSMLSDIELFNKIVSDKKFVEKPLATIRNSVQERLIQDDV